MADTKTVFYGTGRRKKQSLQLEKMEYISSQVVWEEWG